MTRPRSAATIPKLFPRHNNATSDRTMPLPCSANPIREREILLPPGLQQKGTEGRPDCRQPMPGTRVHSSRRAPDDKEPRNDRDLEQKQNASRASTCDNRLEMNEARNYPQEGGGGAPCATHEVAQARLKSHRT